MAGMTSSIRRMFQGGKARPKSSVKSIVDTAPEATIAQPSEKRKRSKVASIMGGTAGARLGG